MAIPVTCPGCQSVYSVPDNLLGKSIRCKGCGETMPVEAAPAARPAARPVAARPAARVVDDEDRPSPARTARARREDDLDDDTPARGRGKPEKSGSKLPLILGAVLGVLLLGGGAVAALFVTGVVGGTDSTEVVETNNTNALPPGPSDDRATPPAEKTDAATTDKENAAAPVGPKSDGTQKVKKDGGRPPQVYTPAKVETPAPKGPVAATGVATGMAPTKENIDTITLNNCKAAAVFIKAETNKGGGTGSGWFGMEPNLIFTNAHVLSMIAPGSPKPTKLTVWVNPGTPEEKEIPHNKLEILAVDRNMDLAVIRVLNETGLPAPLQVRRSTELRDLERLVVLGYPGGMRLSERNRSTKPPAVTIAEARVQTLRKDDNGNLYSVQMQSNVVHGNSGGPIVDADGNVVAVAVRVDLDREGRFTGIAYGVPTEYVIGLLAGRVAEVEYGQAYKKGGKIHIPVTAHCLDPLERLKSVGVSAWVGETDTKATRPPGAEHKTAEGDLHYAEIDLNYKYSKNDPTATGEIVLPELPKGRSYWAQPFYANALLPKYYLAGNKVQLSGPPVDLVPADLIVRYNAGSKRQLTLSNSSSLEEFEEGEGADKSERLLFESELKMTETVQRPTDRGAQHSLLFQYEEVKLKAQVGAKTLDDILPKEFRNLLGEGIKRVQGLGHVNKAGEIYKTLSDVRGVGQFAPLFKSFSDDAMDSLMATSLPLPNAKVEPNHTWTSTKSYRLQATFADGSEVFGPDPKAKEKPKSRTREYRYQQNVTYTYIGSRSRAGTKEAVIKIEGTISAAPGSTADSGAHGELKGYAYIDLDSGVVLESEVEREMEIDTSASGVKKRISGINKYKLTRGSSITN